MATSPIHQPDDTLTQEERISAIERIECPDLFMAHFGSSSEYWVGVLQVVWARVNTVLVLVFGAIGTGVWAFERVFPSASAPACAVYLLLALEIVLLVRVAQDLHDATTPTPGADPYRFATIAKDLRDQPLPSSARERFLLLLTWSNVTDQLAESNETRLRSAARAYRRVFPPLLIAVSGAVLAIAASSTATLDPTECIHNGEATSTTDKHIAEASAPRAEQEENRKEEGPKEAGSLMSPTADGSGKEQPTTSPPPKPPPPQEVTEKSAPPPPRR